MSGYRSGERHHRTKDSNDVVNRARELRKQDLSYAQIANILHIPKWTIRDWIQFNTRGKA